MLKKYSFHDSNDRSKRSAFPTPSASDGLKLGVGCLVSRRVLVSDSVM